MDYSSAADVPVAKAFDNIIENDQRGNFMLDNSAKCFNTCVLKITSVNLTQEETSCLKDCYVKSYYTHSTLESQKF